ncbi:MAG: transcriptional regulator [Dehalococcoidia bacterium]
MQDAESLIQQPARLRIMAALAALPVGEQMTFGDLRELVPLTAGNMSSHLSMLERAGYVSVDKGYDGKRPRTWIWATSQGRGAFAGVIDELEQIIANVRNGKTTGASPAAD